MNDPTWWPLFRRIVIFMLGCGVIVDALILNHLGTLIVGLLMVGVLPLDDLIALSARPAQRREDTATMTNTETIILLVEVGIIALAALLRIFGRHG